MVGAKYSKFDEVTDNIASFALYSLCTVRALLQAILQTEDMLKVYEARLTEEETVYLDLDKVEAYRCGLKVMWKDITVAPLMGNHTELSPQL